MKSFQNGRPISYFFLTIVFVAGIGASAAIFYGLSIQERNDGNLDNATVPTVEAPSSSTSSVDLSKSVSRETTEVTHSPTYSLTDIAKLHSPLERSTALHIALSEANEDRVLALLDQSKQLDNLTRVQTQAVILQKLVRVNPTSALTQIAEFNQPDSSDVLSAMFSEWAQFDLHEAISHAITLDSTGKQAALEGILQERIDLTDQKRREIARRLGNEQYAINVITLEKLNKSIAEPEEVWEGIVQHAQKDSDQLELLTQIAQIWVEKQGLEALDHIFSSLDNKQTKSHISIAVFRELAQTNPRAAFAYGVNSEHISPYDAEVIVVAEWAQFDPQGALDAVISMPEEKMRKSSFKKIVETLATYNPHAILAEFDSLPNNVVKLATKTAVSVLASSSPLDAAAIVSTMEDEPLKGDCIRSVIHHWIARDMDAVLDWVLKDPDLEFQRTQVTGYVLRTLVEHDPERAMRIALAYPLGEDEVGPEDWIIAKLSRIDIDKAIEYLPRVRDGITKTESYRSVAFNLAEQGLNDKALQLLKQVPDYAKKTYLSRWMSAWVHFDPTDVYESLDQMPSADIASLAALNLLTNDPWRKHLNSKQTEKVRAHLTEEDSKRFKRLSLKTFEIQSSWR
ncbi:MAG: hypothetical protein OXH31_00375 [Gammaproteobacteria bacterium]|nr:hypothetical protein [Gammaproteobacteria bacterium]